VYDTTNSGLPSRYAYDVAIDSSGNKWIPGLRGVAMFDDKRDEWTVYDATSANGLSGRYYDVEVDASGIVWASGDTPPVKFDGTRWTRPADTTLEYRLARANLAARLAIDGRGNTWAAIDGCMARIDSASTVVYYRTWPPSGKGISCVVVDAESNPWVATAGGVARYDPDLTSQKRNAAVADAASSRENVRFRAVTDNGAALSIGYHAGDRSGMAVRIYDVRGRLVQTLTGGVAGQSGGTVDWNKKDWRGRPVSPGTYVIRLCTRASTVARTISVVR